MLLERKKVNVVKAIEDLACLQGQWAPSPYVALWSRLAGFKREQLTGAIDRGDVVKTTIMRATLHLSPRASTPRTTSRRWTVASERGGLRARRT